MIKVFKVMMYKAFKVIILNLKVKASGQEV